MHRKNGTGSNYTLFDVAQYSYFLEDFVLKVLLFCYFLCNMKDVKEIIETYIF